MNERYILYKFNAKFHQKKVMSFHFKNHTKNWIICGRKLFDFRS